MTTTSERAAQQALDWLRAELAAHEKQLASGTPADRTFVKQRLTHWQKDADLAGIRDQTAWAMLNAQERETCQKLWADVEMLLKNLQVSRP